jgi:hypothetical protein
MNSRLLPACAHPARPGLAGLAPMLGRELPAERRADVRAQLAQGSDAERALAAALRSAFLAPAFQGAPLDPVDVAQRLDAGLSDPR